MIQKFTIFAGMCTEVIDYNLEISLVLVHIFNYAVII
jgi:hypothetical protein